MQAPTLSPKGRRIILTVLSRDTLAMITDKLDLAIVDRRAQAAHIEAIMEIKGQEREQDRAKYTAADRWCRAVNYHGEFGCWAFRVCKEPHKLRELIALYRQEISRDSIDRKG